MITLSLVEQTLFAGFIIELFVLHLQMTLPSISTATDIFPASSITSNTTTVMSSLSENAPQASSFFDLAPSSTIVSATISGPSTSQFSNNVKPVAAEEMLETLTTRFLCLTLHSS